MSPLRLRTRGLRLLVIAGLTLVAPLGVAASATSATAGPAPAGSITVLPATGSDLTPFTLITSNACPSGGNVYASIFGKGFPATGQVIVGNSPTAIYEHTVRGGSALPIADTIRDFVNLQPDPVPLAGSYRLQVSCRNGPLVADLGEFEGSITFTDPHTYTAHNPRLSAADLALLPAVGIAHSLKDPPKAAAPTAAPAGKPAAAAATKTSTSRGENSGALWLYAIGGLLVLFGVAVAVRGRRGSAAAA